LHWGGYLGGPVFKKVMSFVLKDQHVPPTLPAVNNYALDEKELKAKIAAAEAVRKQQSRSGSNG
jgi:cell division protein FtsI (penicillin-binding protein 3)